MTGRNFSPLSLSLLTYPTTFVEVSLFVWKMHNHTKHLKYNGYSQRQQSLLIDDKGVILQFQVFALFHLKANRVCEDTILISVFLFQLANNSNVSESDEK